MWKWKSQAIAVFIKPSQESAFLVGMCYQLPLSKEYYPENIVKSLNIFLKIYNCQTKAINEDKMIIYCQFLKQRNKVWIYLGAFYQILHFNNHYQKVQKSWVWKWNDQLRTRQSLYCYNANVKIETLIKFLLSIRDGRYDLSLVGFPGIHIKFLIKVGRNKNLTPLNLDVLKTIIFTKRLVSFSDSIVSAPLKIGKLKQFISVSVTLCIECK